MLPIGGNPLSRSNADTSKAKTMGATFQTVILLKPQSPEESYVVPAILLYDIVSLTIHRDSSASLAAQTIRYIHPHLFDGGQADNRNRERRSSIYPL